MEQKVSFNYFYGSQADQYSFYRIPKALFKNDYFRGLSSDAKILYGLMLDRMSLSIKNQWFDDENRAYIYFSIEDIMELLNCGRNKAVKSLQELDSENGIGLIEKKRQGFGKTNIIYVKSFMMADEEKLRKIFHQIRRQSHKSLQFKLMRGKSQIKKFTKQTSRSPKNKLQEVLKINFKKFTFQTLIIITLVIIILVIMNHILSNLRRIDLITIIKHTYKPMKNW